MSGPSWELIATGAVGLLFTIGLLWLKSVSTRQANTEKTVIELQKAMLSQYHPKTDIAEMMKEVRDALKELRLEFRENQREWKDKFAHLESIYGR